RKVPSLKEHIHPLGIQARMNSGAGSGANRYQEELPLPHRPRKAILRQCGNEKHEQGGIVERGYASVLKDELVSSYSHALRKKVDRSGSAAPNQRGQGNVQIAIRGGEEITVRGIILRSSAVGDWPRGVGVGVVEDQKQ